MEMPFLDPSGHVFPHAYGQRLTQFWIRVSLACAGTTFVWVAIVFSYGRALLTGGSLTTGSQVCTFLSAMAVAPLLAFALALARDSEFDFVAPSIDVLRLTRTPVGWALLREGAALRKRRSDLIDAWYKLAIIAFPQPVYRDDLEQMERTLNKLWDPLIQDEIELLARQRRYLAGETVAFDVALASAP